MYINKLPMVGTKQETIKHYELQIEVLREAMNSVKSEMGQRLIPVMKTVSAAFAWSIQQIEIKLRYAAANKRGLVLALFIIGVTITQ